MSQVTMPTTHAGTDDHARVAITSAPRSIERPRIAWLNFGWVVVVAAMVLSIVGIIAIGTTEQGFATRQMVFLPVALLVAAGVACLHHRSARQVSWICYWLVIALLVFVLIKGVPQWLVTPRNGARRWISLGLIDVQPSELAKIAWVLAIASWLRFRRNHRHLRGLLVPFLLTLLPIGLILLEPDLGTAMLFIPTLLAMLVVAGARLKHMMAIVLLGLVVAPLAYPVLRPHQKARIDAMVAQVMGDDRYADDIGFQGLRAMTVVGSGGVEGVGVEHAEALVQFNALPEDHNDMIFAVICCRWGLLGGAMIWMLFMALSLGGLLIASMSRDPFARIVAVGISTMIFLQMLINTGMTIGLFPITGMTLPLVSYGGSSLVTTWIMIGLLLGIALRRPRPLTPPSFEFDEERS